MLGRAVVTCSCGVGAVGALQHSGSSLASGLSQGRFIERNFVVGGFWPLLASGPRHLCLCLESLMLEGFIVARTVTGGL